ncbi:hypothetical protein [Paucisalibacillus globulus]|uniref:hypothetical protein n=1 Tax=Paucisalibacillus globulus TaxID=351095 RepID=UPI00042477A8|nr:hypothetical protein [Paucisalibacillus globulus]
MLVQAVITIGAVLAVIAIILGFIFLKSTGGKGYLAYYPSAILFFGGIIVVCAATPKKIMIWEAGLGGWGIACLFAAAISFMVTSVSHAYQAHDAKA